MISWCMENVTVSPKEKEEPLPFAVYFNWKSKTQASFIAEQF